MTTEERLEKLGKKFIRIFRVKGMLLLVTVSFMLISTAEAVKRSKVDQERENQAQARKKQAEELREQKRLKFLLETDASFYFEKKIKGVYCLNNGKVEKIQRIVGKVTKVVDAKSIILTLQRAVIPRISSYGRSAVSINSLVQQGVNMTQYEDADPAIVIMEDVKGLFDGQKLELLVCPQESIKHDNKTWQAFKVVKPMTFDEFKKLWDSGYRLQEESK